MKTKLRQENIKKINKNNRNKLMSFWINKPINVEQKLYVNSSFIFDSKTLLSKIENEIEQCKIKLDYNIIFGSQLDDNLKLDILDFINDNYNNVNDELSLHYSKDLLDYYITSNTMCILFYPKGKISKQTIIGFVCGRPQTICIKDSNTPNSFKQYNSIDVNFLCLVQKLRNLHVSSYIINIITRECLINYNQTINCAAYTVSKSLRVKHFSKKKYYHRPINVDNLIQSNLIIQEKELSILKKIWESFSYKPNFLKNYTFTLFQSENFDIDSIVDQLYYLINYNNKLNYDIYDQKTKSDIKNILTNKSFYNFLIIDKTTNQIQDFISLYNLVTKNLITNSHSRNGYLYILTTKENDDYKSCIIEYISEYCYNHDLFDMITIMDIMEQGVDKYKRLKLLNGTGELYYYLYNINLYDIEPFKNGLITI